MPRIKRFLRQNGRWPVLLLIPTLWCVVAHYGFLNFEENKFLDWRFVSRGEVDAPVNVVYVDVDSESLSTIGGWPWTREHFAKSISALVTQSKVRAIGVDFVFSDNGVPEVVDWKKLVAGNVQLVRMLKAKPAPPVLLACSYAADTDRDANFNILHREFPMIRDNKPLDKVEYPELPYLVTDLRNIKVKWTTPGVGLIDTYEGGMRSVPLFAQTEAKTYYHMGVELLRYYWGLGQDGVVVDGDTLVFRQPDGKVLRRVPMRFGQLLEINWFSHWDSAEKNPHISFSKVRAYADALESDDAEEKKNAEAFFAQPDFKDAIILIGPVDKLLQDVAPTPMDLEAVPRVSVHGNVVKTIASELYLRRLSELQQVAIVFGLTALMSWLAVAGGARSFFWKVLGVLVAAGYVVFSFWIFKQSQLVLPVATPIGAAFTTSLAAAIFQVLHEQKQRGRIKNMFGTYVSPQLVDRMVSSDQAPQLGGHEEEITAYFSDIQSFSTFSEKLPPGQLVDLMNEYLTACTDIVQAQGGTLDKYIGDAVVAMFGAPVPMKDHAFRACVATQLVHRKLGELRVKWEGEGNRWPEIVWKMQSRIGLNSGKCIIGNMGSRTRFNYTMMGDDVNLAARMESGAKSWGVYTMCSEATKQKCIEHGGDRVIFRALGRIVVKGRTKAVPIHEIVGLKEHATAQMLECIALFEQGLERYYVRDWDGACALFARSLELEPNRPGRTPGVVSNPSIIYTEIAEKYKAHPPPENWDTVYIMKEK